jgi:holo-[acyl-carrier protein] synthase
VRHMQGADAAGPPEVTAGVDIVSVARIEGLMRRWGNKFLKRLYTDREIAYCMGRTYPARSLAARFAAKEAFFKAVAPWRPGGIDHKSIEVVTGETGAPAIRPHGPADRALAGRVTSLSLSHESEFAVALVVTSPGGIRRRVAKARKPGEAGRRAR